MFPTVFKPLTFGVYPDKRLDPGTLSVTLRDWTYFYFYVTGICEWVQFN